MANIAIDRICRYFHHEIKVQKIKIDDYEETIRGRKTDIRNLQRGCRLHTTRRQADQKIETCLDAIRGCRAKKNEYLAMNRRLRNKVPLEQYITMIEEDREVVVLD